MPAASWKKSPADLVERFAAALPDHPALVRKPMFGYPAAFANGNMVCGLFQDSVVARLGKEGYRIKLQTCLRLHTAPARLT